MNEVYVVTVFGHRLQCLFFSTHAMIQLISLMSGYLFCSALMMSEPICFDAEILGGTFYSVSLGVGPLLCALPGRPIDV